MNPIDREHRCALIIARFTSTQHKTLYDNIPISCEYAVHSHTCDKVIKMAKPACINPHCHRQSTARGLCGPCGKVSKASFQLKLDAWVATQDKADPAYMVNLAAYKRELTSVFVSIGAMVDKVRSTDAIDAMALDIDKAVAAVNLAREIEECHAYAIEWLKAQATTSEALPVPEVTNVNKGKPTVK
jgi:hypothetical protein